MKKVLILTFQFADNYGALLQAYALKCAIEDVGHQADIANYVSDFNKSEYSRNPFAIKGSIKTKIKKTLKLPLAWKQMKLCNEFRTKYLRLKQEWNRGEFEELAKEYDVLVAGSDQIWNGKLTGNNTAYFLDFGNEIKKISYAASLGTVKMTDFQKDCMKKYVSGFDAVSIREERNLEEVRQVIPEAENVVDPVFLNVRQWNQIAESEKCPVEGKYILYYSLGGGKELEGMAEDLSRTYSLPIIGVHPTAKIYHIRGKQLYNVAPVDFLVLIKNAQIVCTDSFHATCFSIIFEKLLCYKTNPKSPGRAESLLRQLEAIPDNLSTENLSCRLIDCSKINRIKLKQEIAKSKQFLRKALGEGM